MNLYNEVIKKRVKVSIEMNLYNEFMENGVKASIEISFNHKKQLFKEVSKGKIMP